MHLNKSEIWLHFNAARSTGKVWQRKCGLLTLPPKSQHDLGLMTDSRIGHMLGRQGQVQGGGGISRSEYNPWGTKSLWWEQKRRMPEKKQCKAQGDYDMCRSS